MTVDVRVQDLTRYNTNCIVMMLDGINKKKTVEGDP